MSSNDGDSNVGAAYYLNLCLQHLEQLDELDLTEDNLNGIVDSVTEMKNCLYFDMEIICSDIILPCHKNVLSLRSEVLRKKLSSGIKVLDWTEYDVDVATALLCWFYTDKIHFVSDNLAIAILCASFRFELATLFKASEQMLVASVDQSTSLEFLTIAKSVGANALAQKCLQISPSLLRQRTNTISEHLIELATEVCVATDNKAHLKKILEGIIRYLISADMFIHICYSKHWPVHSYILYTRCNVLDKQYSDRTVWFHFSDNSVLALLRWLYTDTIYLDNDDIRLDLLIVSFHLELRPLFEMCEDAIGSTVKISTVSKIIRIAGNYNSTKIFKYCEFLLYEYWTDLQWQHLDELPKIILNSNKSLLGTQETIKEYEIPEVPIMMLTDRCLLKIFTNLTLDDLSSIKTSCQRFYTLADRCFANYANKSFSINTFSMIGDMWNLTHFGQFITSLIIVEKYYWPWDDIFAIVEKFCNKKLWKLCLNFNKDRTVTDGSLKRLKGILQNVEIIQLQDFFHVKHIGLLLNYCTNLKELHVEGEEMEANILWFLNKRNIRRVTMTCMKNDDVLENICRQLVKLEYLDFSCKEITDFGSNKMNHLIKLNHLRALRIGCQDTNIGPIISKLAKRKVLEYLSLSLFDMNVSVANALGEFDNLKELTLNLQWELIPPYVLDVLSIKLVNIERLIFDECNEITFGEIVKIIENLELKELLITECDEITFINPKDTKLSKRRNLKIFLDILVFERTIKLHPDYSAYLVQISKIPENWNRWHA